MTAIRIADIFQVPHEAPESPAIQFYVVASLRSVPAVEGKVGISVFITGPSGKRERLPDPPGSPFELSAFQNDKSIPNGISIVLQLNINVHTMGTAYLELCVDDETALTIPFTILRLPPKVPVPKE